MGGLFLWNVTYALHRVAIPSSCGMLIYKVVTSIETRTALDLARNC